MKSVNATPTFKKDDRTDKVNYRPNSILQNLSKVLERYLYNQLYPFFDKILSKEFQCSTLYYQTKRKMEAMFRPKFDIWCFAN